MPSMTLLYLLALSKLCRIQDWCDMARCVWGNWNAPSSYSNHRLIDLKLSLTVSGMCYCTTSCTNEPISWMLRYFSVISLTWMRSDTCCWCIWYEDCNLFILMTIAADLKTWFGIFLWLNMSATWDHVRTLESYDLYALTTWCACIRQLSSKWYR